MIFPKLTLETVLQIDDKTRLDASLCFITPDESEITNVEIKPDDASDYISVFVEFENEKWFLDWAYDTDGIKNVEVKVTTATGARSRFYQINVLSVEDDALFSNDTDLFPYEPELYRYLPVGKNSFIYAHRASQNKILAYLDEQRIWKSDKTRFSKQDIVDVEEFKRWSMFQTLLIIFESIQASSNDFFQEKRMEYEKEMRSARNRAALRLDVDGDGVVDEVPYTIRTARLFRR